MVANNLTEEFPKPIDDQTLILWFMKNHLNIRFLNFKVHSRYPSQVKDIKKQIKTLDPKNDLYRQKEQLLKIWESLIGSAIVFLKSRDKREIHHDDEDYGVINLSKFFKSFTDFESVFYGADEYYRDHVSHMFKVFLLGEYLLTKNKLFSKIKIGDDFLDDSFQISNEEKEAIWCIASLTHDLGYGMRLLPKINLKTRSMLEKFDIFNIQEMGFPFPNQTFNEFVITFMSSDLRELSPTEMEFWKKEDSNNSIRPEDRRKFVNHTQTKYLLKFSNSFNHFGHGVFSSILLMKNLIYFLESDFSLDPSKPLNQFDARNFLIRQSILRSIASHDCDDIYYLTLPQFPFLLRIIDEMQDWGRPGLSDLFKNKPGIELYVEKMDKSNLSYKVVYLNSDDSPLNRKEIEEMTCFIRGEFKRKCDRFRKILRSAVGGEYRNLILSFEIEDQISSKTERLNYSFIHRTPKDVRVKINEKDYSWNDYIELEDRKSQQRKQIIHKINRLL